MLVIVVDVINSNYHKVLVRIDGKTFAFFYNSNQEFIEDYENIKNSNYNIVNLEKRYKR